MRSENGSKLKGTWLFSVDLEDVRLLVSDGASYRERVPDMARRYLEFLALHDHKATFFVVGKVALQYPDLIAEIQACGHEIACHSHSHVPLDKLGVDGFQKDLEDNIEALARAGAIQPRGYRAPTFSLTSHTQWAYSILRDYGIHYSSSVLPVRNPLYGWPGFGLEPRVISGVTEIPVTVAESPFMRVPFGGGVYFRVIPFFFTEMWFRQRLRRGAPVTSYVHPYDIDHNQERFMHPGIHGNRIYNWLMYVNRKKVLTRLDRILNLGYSILPYAEYVRSISCDAALED